MNITPKVVPHTKDAYALLSCKEAKLVHSYGDHALAFFGLAPENTQFLAPGGAGLVCYRVIGNVAVVLGDPICAANAREQVMQAFSQFCALRRWQVVIYQASAAMLTTAHALKQHAMKMGEEAIINPQTFTLHGSTMANVRTSSRRAQSDKVTLQWYEGTSSIEEIMPQLRHVSDAWLTKKTGKQTSERGFCMGRLEDLGETIERADRLAVSIALSQKTPASTLPRLITEVAMTHTGTVCAFVTFTPTYGRIAQVEDKNTSRMQGGWTLDLMRRTPDAPPGVMELLLVHAIERLRSYGATRVSLGMVAWADTKQQMTPLQRRLTNFATSHLDLLASRHTLFKFKQKFHPYWESRYLMSSSLISPWQYLAILRLRNGTRHTP